ncbi:hypothetical protein C8J57DRAFT_1226749 [Mycena rebaudengoi]|nr:hypothetical protein C8J57DRAFT_1226749 [Mycena rebaudengoi]
MSACVWALEVGGERNRETGEPKTGKKTPGDSELPADAFRTTCTYEFRHLRGSIRHTVASTYIDCRSSTPVLPATGGAEPLGTAPSTLISLFGVSLPEPRQWTNATHNIPVPAAQHNFPYLQCLVLRQVRRATATAVGGREGFDATRWRREKLPPGDYNTVHAQCTRHGLRFPTPRNKSRIACNTQAAIQRSSNPHGSVISLIFCNRVLVPELRHDDLIEPTYGIIPRAPKKLKTYVHTILLAALCARQAKNASSQLCDVHWAFDIKEGQGMPALESGFGVGVE